jgi:predicted nucleotidyltransferase
LAELAKIVEKQEQGFPKIQITLEKESDLQQLVQETSKANAATIINLNKELSKRLTKRAMDVVAKADTKE